MAKKPDVRVVKLADIRENPVALRGVNRECEEYIGLRDSIATVGILSPFSVRERSEDIDGEIITYFEVCDGLHRYSCALDLGLEDVAVDVKDLDDAQTLEAQVMANVHKIETQPVQYTKQLQRIFAANPTLTLANMAAKLAKSPAWVSQRLKLLKLDKPVADLVDDGKITVSNAVQLSKLPVEEQVNYVDQAVHMDSEEFVPLVSQRAKEIRDAARQGRAAGPAVFTPTARSQKMSVLKDEYEKSTVGPNLCDRCEADNAAAGFALAIAWVLNLDPVSVEVRTAKDAEKKQKLADEKKQRAAERAKKKADEATKLAAKAAEEAGA